ncbi:MAG TPA: phosphoribosylformylglycinamidine synthase subunit PurL, partial [Armatimonadetes bacterium]|nr:phosphoribosylformylglycinamidine synthase subunit PurL [Armatimonadota bacterium]
MAEEMRKVAREMGLRDNEYDLIVKTLGREPTFTEVGMYAVMWSEHCAYKYSRPLLRLLPTEGPHVIQGPGENAGVVDLGGGWAVAFKIESHNHPSAIEPYQGAATGIGGIVRDILSMGARPIALLDSLHFGEIEDEHSRYLFDGVVAGIAGYGNCIGVPTVAGEVYFEPSYADNPLVNVMCVGLLRREELMLARAVGEGNAVLIVGSRTGRDGIHGVTFASEELTEESEERRPSVQVGDPFAKKSLIEATLEALRTGYVVGIQDMGGAGITCSTCETAAKAGTGIELELSRIPLREEGMTPYEIMLSESQERMLLIVKRGHEEEIRKIFHKWGLVAEVMGRVTSDGMLRVKERGRVVAEVPAKSLAEEAPTYTNERRVPKHVEEARRFNPLSLPMPRSLEESAIKVLSSPTVASKRWVYEQYDHMVLINTVLLPGLGAGVLRVKGTPKAIAVTTDCNGRYCHFDPKEGAKAAVAEAARNLSCVGAEPLGITDCLNFGNPEDPEVYWSFCEAVEGMAEACRALGIPVVSGNVSFYNESPREAVYPTPVVGMVGLIPDVRRCGRGAAFPEGTRVALLGLTRPEVGASEYLKRVHGLIDGLPPRVDLDFERRVQEVTREALRSGLAVGAHDLSEGGLLVALSE